MKRIILYSILIALHCTNVMSQSLQTINKQISIYESQIEDHKSQIQVLESKIKELKSKRNELKNDKTADLAEQYRNNKILLQGRFFDMYKKDFLKNVEKFSSMQGYDDYKKRVEDAKKKYDLYEKCRDALGRLDGVNDAVDLREQLLAYLDIKRDNPRNGKYAFTEIQRKEMDSLNVALSRFRGGIQAFQQLINDIKTVRNSSVSKAQKKQRIDAILLTKDVVEKKNRYFDIIPVLKVYYTRFCEELEKNPTKKTRYEDDILKVKLN